MPVIVGVILAVMFLVTFSGWFFEYASGLHELVLDDRFYTYRIVGASLVSIVLFITAFYGISLINQCPKQERSGIFAGLRCETYLSLKAGTDHLFQPKNQPVDESLQ